MGAPGRIASQVILKEWKKSASSSRSDRSKPIASNGAKPRHQPVPAHAAPPTPEPPAPVVNHEGPSITEALNAAPLTADDVANAPSDTTIAPDSEKN
jgi:hypothetical protein